MTAIIVTSTLPGFRYMLSYPNFCMGCLIMTNGIFVTIRMHVKTRERALEENM